MGVLDVNNLKKEFGSDLLFKDVSFTLNPFDKLAIISKAGILIPITGFANSITSCALEGKTEGSLSLSSKLGVKSTVSLLIFLSNSREILDNLESV